MGLVRGVVGFTTFFAAFVLKKQGEPAWVYGLVLIGSAVGNGLGTIIAPLLRRKVREEWILAGSLVVPAIPLIFAARSYGRRLARVRGRGGRGRRGIRAARVRQPVAARRPEAARGRAFARFETRFQVVWVIGGADRGRCSSVAVGPASSSWPGPAVRWALVRRSGAPRRPRAKSRRRGAERLDTEARIRGARIVRRPSRGPSGPLSGKRA